MERALDEAIEQLRQAREACDRNEQLVAIERASRRALEADHGRQGATINRLHRLVDDVRTFRRMLTGRIAQLRDAEHAPARAVLQGDVEYLAAAVGRAEGWSERSVADHRAQESGEVMKRDAAAGFRVQEAERPF